MVLAKVIFQQGAAEEGLAMMESAVQGMQEFLGWNPSSKGAIQNSAMFDAELGVMQLYLEHLDEAHQSFGRSVRELDALHEKHPGDLRIQDELEEALYGLLVTLQEEGRTKEAEQTMVPLVKLRTMSLDTEPTNTAKQGRLLMAIARSGDLERGLEIALELESKLSSHDTLRYDLACGYAQLARAQKRPRLG